MPAAQLAAALGVKVYTIGIGIEQPCKLPLFDPATGKLELGRQRQRQSRDRACSRPITPCWAKCPRCRSAKFYRATNRRELQRIYNEIDRLEKTEVKLRRFTTYRPLFQWPLLAAFGLAGAGIGAGQHPVAEGAVRKTANSERRIRASASASARLYDLRPSSFCRTALAVAGGAGAGGCCWRCNAIRPGRGGSSSRKWPRRSSSTN